MASTQAETDRMPFCSTVQEQRELCASCQWAATGTNCWEVERSPCCQLSRASCPSCHVYIAHLRASATPVPALLALRNGAVLEGHVHVPARSRISDLLNAPDRRFLVVTGPVWRRGRPEELPEGNVIMVNVSNLTWVMPLGGEADAADASRPARRTAA